MRQFCSILVFFLFVGIAYAQESQDSRNMVRVGLNGAFFGSGDVLGIGVSTEYAYQFSDYLAITPRIMIANANSRYNVGNLFTEFHQISTFGTSLSIRITPFPGSFNRLKIDGGVLYQRFTKTWGQLGSKDMYGTYESDFTNYYFENLYGFLGSVNVNVIETKRLESGLRFELLTSLYKGHLECDGVQCGIYFGIKY